jgi:hypothetical protein
MQRLDVQASSHGSIRRTAAPRAAAPSFEELLLAIEADASCGPAAAAKR